MTPSHLSWPDAAVMITLIVVAGVGFVYYLKRYL
jgi:hypothetical protein